MVISDWNPEKVIPRSGPPVPRRHRIAEGEKTGHPQNLLVRAALEMITGLLLLQTRLKCYCLEGPSTHAGLRTPACPSELGYDWSVGLLSAHPPPGDPHQREFQNSLDDQRCHQRGEAGPETASVACILFARD